VVEDFSVHMGAFGKKPSFFFFFFFFFGHAASRIITVRNKQRRSQSNEFHYYQNSIVLNEAELRSGITRRARDKLGHKSKEERDGGIRR